MAQRARLACAALARLLLALALLPHALGLRYWMDIYAFAPGETVLLAEAINATGGVDVLAGTSHGGFLAPKGWHDANLWDVYWTGREVCLREAGRAGTAWVEVGVDACATCAEPNQE